MEKISVIIPFYHGNKYIDNLIKTLEKAINIVEDFCEVEVIIVNDSPDCEIDIKYDYKINIIITFNDKNHGIHYSRVKGLLHSKGNYIVFLDQDDSVDEKYFISQLSALSEADIVICNGVFQDNRVIISDNEKKRIEDKYGYAESLKDIVSPGQALIRRKAIPREWIDNIMNENYCDDAFLWLLMKNNNKKFVVNKEMLYRHVEHGNNSSLNFSNNIKAMSELKCIINEKNLLDKKMTSLVNITLQKKIEKQKIYQKTEVIINTFCNDLNNGKIHIKDLAIGVFGYGNFGKTIINCFKQNNVNKLYIIDNYYIATKSEECSLYTEKDNWPPMDVLIITLPYSFNDIKMRLENRAVNEIISVNDIYNISFTD